jgi:ABC-type spermidine/putrescine transport system permease subunit II
MRVSESTRRALRTLLQVAVALPTIVPVVAAGVGWLTAHVGADHVLVRWGVAALVGLTAMSKFMGWLEERGYLRPVMRSLGEEEHR